MITFSSKIDVKFKENLLIATYQDGQKKPKTNCNNKEALKAFDHLTKSKSLTGSKSEVLVVRPIEGPYKTMIFWGLGKGPDEESVRRSVALLYRKLESEKITHSQLCSESLSKILKKDEDIARLCAEGLNLAAYSYDLLKTDKEKQKKPLIQVSGNKAFQNGFKEGEILADSANFARMLGDSPANYMTPSILAKKTQEKAKGTKLKVSVWDESRIKKEKFGCMIGVAKGSDEPARVIVLEYNGAAKSQKPMAFVGKGLTFDSGGISLKPGQSMEEMKFDMCGGANVIGAMMAIARLGIKANVFAIVGATENMPSARATKPSDVLVARNGKTVEVTNTDAEGRLVLADLLCYTSEKKPTCIIDAATLTGAMVVALGDLHTGFYTSSDKLAKKIQEASEYSGEWVWRMPVTKEHTSDMKGLYSDLNNMGSTKKAGSAQAAAFLKEFVPEEIPYAHFDIAGTAWNCQNRIKYYKSGATGVMVRTFVEFAKKWK